MKHEIGEAIILLVIIGIMFSILWFILIYPNTLQPYDKCREICNSSYMGKMELGLGFNKYKCENGNAEWTSTGAMRIGDDGFWENYHREYGRCVKR